MKLPPWSLSIVHEKFVALSARQKALLFAGTVFILLGGFYVLYYTDRAEEIKRLEANLREQQRRLEVLKQAAAQLPKLQEELAQSEEDFAHLLKLLPDQKEVPSLLETLSQLGAQVGLENILFQPQPEQTHEFYATIPIRLDLLGTYHRMGAFFDGISKLNRILKVENLTMVRQKGGSNLQAACVVVTYRFLDKASEAPDSKKGK